MCLTVPILMILKTLRCPRVTSQHIFLLWRGKRCKLRQLMLSEHVDQPSCQPPHPYFIQQCLRLAHPVANTMLSPTIEGSNVDADAEGHAVTVQSVHELAAASAGPEPKPKAPPLGPLTTSLKQRLAAAFYFQGAWTSSRHTRGIFIT